MVISKVNSKVSYPEIKTIDEDDKGQDVSMYKIFLFKMPLVIALGNIKYTFIDKKVLYAPVYLVVDDANKIYQIGVYEFKSSEYENLLDTSNDLDISLLEEPLLYSFVDKAYLEKCMENEILLSDEDSGDETSVTDSEEEEEEEEKKEERKEGEEDTSSKSKSKHKGPNPPPILVELDIESYEDDDDFLRKGETKQEDRKERKKYKPPQEGESQWLETFLNNNNYNIIDNEGGGDCLFATIRDAFKSIKINATVPILRNMVSEQVDESVFQTYKEQFDAYNSELQNVKKEIKKVRKVIPLLVKQYNKLAKSSKKEKDAPTKKKLVKKAKKIKSAHSDEKTKLNRLQRELANVKINLKDWTWMTNIKTMSDLKRKMKTCKFWADVWAMSSLEMILNTKIIVLSSEFYNKGLYQKVLLCGDVVPTKIEEKGYFKPKYYIIVEHTGIHYKLITYKEHHIFRFSQIPYGIKALIADTCMKSKGKTLYNYIPKFAKIIGETIIVPEKKESAQEGKSGEEEEEEQEEEIEVTPTPTPEDGDLFDDDTVLMFYSKSADKKPGKGNGETISEDKLIEFNELAKIKNWRKVLSNFYTKPKENDKVVPLFKLDGLNWASVEHNYHGNKFKKNNPDYYKLFAIDSGSQIMDDPKKALGAGGKTGKIAGKKFRPKNITMDEDFFDGKNNEKVMERAQQAKYEQDELARKVLLATKDAKLVHYVSSRKPKGERPPPVIFYDTMRIRNRLNK